MCPAYDSKINIRSEFQRQKEYRKYTHNRYTYEYVRTCVVIAPVSVSSSYVFSLTFVPAFHSFSFRFLTLIGYEGKTTKLRKKRLLLRRHIVATAEQCTKIFHRTSKNSGARVSVGVKSVSSLFLLPREREYNFLLLISFAHFNSIYNSMYIT